MNETLKTYYEYLRKVGADAPDTFESFSNTLSDEGSAQKYYEYLKSSGFDAPDTFESFSTTLGIKKKEPTVENYQPLSKEEEKLLPPSSAVSSPSVVPEAEPEKKGLIGKIAERGKKLRQVDKDLVRSLKSGTIRLLGGAAGFPQLVDNSIDRVIMYPIFKAMSPEASEDEIFGAIDAMQQATPGGVNLKALSVYGGKSQDKLEKMAVRTDAKMKQIEGNMVENFKKGDIEAGIEVWGRNLMQVIPSIVQMMATGGLGAVPSLAGLGATAASQQYDSIEGREDLSSGQKTLNSWLYGGLEAAGELFTFGLFNRMAKAIRGTGKTVSKNIVDKISQQIAKRFGLTAAKTVEVVGAGIGETGSEEFTQVGQNLTAVLTGEDENRGLFDGWLDVAAVSFVPGAGMTSIKVMMEGRSLATKKELDVVNKSHENQATVIEQIEETSDPTVKKALETELVKLKDDEYALIDKNIEISQALTPEQKAEVAKLQIASVELSTKIELGELMEDEQSAVEATIKDIDKQIEAIKKEGELVIKEREKGGVSEGVPAVEAIPKSGTPIPPEANTPTRIEGAETPLVNPETAVTPETTPSTTMGEKVAEIAPNEVVGASTEETAPVEVTSILIAPYRAKKALGLDDEAVFEDEKYKELEDTAKGIMKAMGFPDAPQTRQIGGWFEGNERVTESSLRIDMPTQNQEDIDMASALLGSLAPQTQNSVGQVKHKRGEGGTWFDIAVNDTKIAEKVTDEIKKLGFSYRKGEKMLYIATQNENEFNELLKVLKDNGTGITKVRTSEAGVNYFMEGDFLPTLERYGDRSHGRYGRDGGDNLFNYVTQATAKLRGNQGATTTEVIPPVGPPQETPKEEKPDKDTFERETLRKMRDDSMLSPQFRIWLSENGITTTRLPNEITSAEVDFIIASNGVDKASMMLKDSGNNIPLAVRNLMGVRIAKTYDDLASAAEKENDLEGENLYRTKALEIALWLGETSTETARGLQILGSVEALGILSPKTLLKNAERETRRQRDKGISKNKKDIEGKKEILTKAQEEAVDELGKRKEYTEAKKRVVRAEPAVRKQVPKEVLAKEKAFRATKWAELRKAHEAAKERGSSIGFAVTPLHAEEVAIAGEIARSYIRSGLTTIQDVAERLQREWKKFMGEDLDPETALSLVPQETDGRPTQEILDENAEDKAAESLTKRAMRMLADPKVAKDDPVVQMINTLFAKIKEKDTNNPEVKKKSDIEKIREAITDKKEYASVWEEAKKLVAFRIESNEGLSEEQKADYNQRLQKFYDEVIGEPFSQKQVEGATKNAMKELDIRLDEIVKQHYTVYDATRRTLQEKLVDELGLTEEDAKMFADAVGREFDKIATERKRKALMMGIRPKEVLHPKQAKATWEKLVELTNLGAWSDAEIADAYAEKWGMPKLTDVQKKEIERLAELVQKAHEGSQKFEATQNMLRYIAKMDGMDLGEVGMAMWYSSILSGPRTQFKNVFANMMNTLAEFAVSLRRPQFAPQLLYGLGTGWVHGTREAAHILSSGYTPIRYGKIEVPPTLELWKFKGKGYNPANWGKYVARVMMAADAFSYHGLKEMRAWELAMLEARKEGKGKPYKEHWAKATELLYLTNERRSEAELEAKNDGLKGNEFHRRVWELMEQSRPLQMEEETNSFASRGTFNHAPEGTLGLLTDLVGRATQNVAIKVTPPFSNKTVTIRPIKFVVPFTRIISNVANTAIDYTPYGLVRWGKGGLGFETYEKSAQTKKFRREYTDDERQRVLAKAMIGISAMTAVLLLSGDDDDGEPPIRITANGTGDFRKNYELKEAGEWQSYSIKIGKKWYSYQYTPLFLALAPIGYLRDAERYQKEDFDKMNTWDVVQVLLSKTATAIADMSWMSSVSGLLDAVSSDNITDFDRWWEKTMISMGKSVAYPKLAEQTIQIIDYFSKNPRKEASGIIGKIAKDTPITRKGMNDMLNAVGDPVMYDPFMLVETETSDPFWNYVVKHNAWIGKPSQKSIQVYDDKIGKERGLTDNEYYQYVRLSGKAIKDRIVNEVISKELSEEEIKREVDGIKTEERKKAREMMFGWGEVRMANPELWSFLVDNNLLPARGSVTIGGKSVSDDKELNAYWKDVEKQFSGFLGETKNEKLLKEEQDVWREDVISLLWGMAQDIVQTQREAELAD